MSGDAALLDSPPAAAEERPADGPLHPARRAASVAVAAIGAGLTVVVAVDGSPVWCVVRALGAVLLTVTAFRAVRTSPARRAALVARAQSRMPDVRFSIEDRLIFEPTHTPEDAPVIGALTGAIALVTGRQAALVASPGTYDHKHVARIAGVPHCVAYGPGELALAHQPDEYCSVADIIAATKVLALAVIQLAE